MGCANLISSGVSSWTITSRFHGNQIFSFKQTHLKQDGGADNCFSTFLSSKMTINPFHEAKITSNQAMRKALVQVKVYRKNSYSSAISASTEIIHKPSLLRIYVEAYETLSH